jgi:hypothetical protein
MVAQMKERRGLWKHRVHLLSATIIYYYYFNLLFLKVKFAI